MEDRVFRVDDQQLGIVCLVADIATDGCRSASRACTHDDGVRYRAGFLLHLAEDTLGDVVVATPVRCPFCIGELVQKMAVERFRKADRFLVHLRAVVDKVATSAIELDQPDLAGRCRCRHDSNKRYADHPRKVGFGDGRAAGGGLDDCRLRPDLAVAKGIEEEGAGKPVLETARRMRAFVLEVEIDAGQGRQFEPDQVRIGRSLVVCRDFLYRGVYPVMHCVGYRICFQGYQRSIFRKKQSLTPGPFFRQVFRPPLPRAPRPARLSGSRRYIRKSVYPKVPWSCSLSAGHLPRHSWHCH